MKIRTETLARGWRWAAALAAVAALIPSGFAAAISDSTAAPVNNIVFQGATDNGTTSVRWRDNGNDTDMGSTFQMGSFGALLESVTVRIAPANLGSAVPGMPVVFDFFSFDGQNTFTPLWRETGTFPATTAADDYITFHLSSRDQLLDAGSFYAFLIGADLEDTSGADAGRFRLYTAASDAVPNAFEVRRESEFGPTRPSLASAPDMLNTSRDVLFFVTAVPEPSVFALGAACFLTWLVVTRRRR